MIKHSLATALVNARRESRVLEAAYDVIGLMLHYPDVLPAQYIKSKARYYKVRMEDVRKTVERLLATVGITAKL